MAVAPIDFARRLCLRADTGDAKASSVAATAFSTPCVTELLVDFCITKGVNLLCNQAQRVYVVGAAYSD